MSLAHVGLKGNERDWALSLPTKSCSDSISAEQSSLKVQRAICWVGEKGEDWVFSVHRMPPRGLCIHGSSILPHGDVTPTVHNPGQLEEKASHVYISKSFEIIPEPSTQNILGFTMW